MLPARLRGEGVSERPTGFTGGRVNHSVYGVWDGTVHDYRRAADRGSVSLISGLDYFAPGNPAKAFVIKEKEGHGFGRLENNIDLYTQVLKFLDEQIGK